MAPSRGLVGRPWEAVGIEPRGAAVAELELDQEHGGEHDRGGDRRRAGADRAESAASSERRVRGKLGADRSDRRGARG